MPRKTIHSLAGASGSYRTFIHAGAIRTAARSPRLPLSQSLQPQGDVSQSSGLVSDFALDDQWAGIAGAFQSPEELGDIDLALPEGHFLAPLPRDLGAPRVLDVHRADVR